MSSKDSDVTCTMYTKSNNKEIIIGNETDEIIRELFKSLLQRYQEGLKESMRESEFIKLPKISLNRGGSNIDSLKWLKNNKATINPKNNDDKCFQYAVAVALNNQKIKRNPERI